MIIRQGFATQIDATTGALKRLRDAVENRSRIAVSQMRVQKPSDAAGQWTQIFALDDLLRDQGAYLQNAKSATGALSSAEGALSEATHLLTEARELAVQLASETYNDADRAGAAARIDGIRDTLVGLGNLEYAGRSLFAGTATDGDAFDATGAYLGNADRTQVLVADGQYASTSFDGSAVFGDALQALSDLSAALQSGAGSADATAAQLAALDTARQGVIDGRTRLGFDMLDAEDATAPRRFAWS